MTLESSRRAGRASPAIVVLLSAILVAVAALTVIIGVKGSGGPSPDTTKGQPLKPVESGQTETLDQATAQGIIPSSPSRAEDTGRIREAYQPGKTYRTIVKFNLAGLGRPVTATANNATCRIAARPLCRDHLLVVRRSHECQLD